MNIAVALYFPEHASQIQNLLNGLIGRGHTVRIFTTYRLPDTAHESYKVVNNYDVTYENWANFEMSGLNHFDPDVVLLWNGYAAPTYAAMRQLKRWYTVLHLEMGWLPQSENLYIADDLGPHSDLIVKDIPEACPVDQEALAALRGKYGMPRRCPHLPDEYIFVPAQLDNDTSITVSSPLYKTCDSFIGDLIKHLPDVAIVVKNHPLSPHAPRTPGVVCYPHDGELSSLDLAAHATLVAGITSTVLTEALIYNVPVASFGLNVGMGAHINGHVYPEGAFMQIRRVLKDPSVYQPRYSPSQMLSWLLRRQWNKDLVPEWVYTYIESWL